MRCRTTGGRSGRWSSASPLQRRSSFRLGVVVGDGGMYARIRSSATRLPVTPLLDGGRQLLYVLGIDALCAVLRDAIVAQRRRAARPGLEPGAAAAGDAAGDGRGDPTAAGKRSLLVPVPTKPVLAGLRLAESVPLLRLPVTSTNVRGLIQQGQRRFPSDWERFGYPVSRWRR